MEASRPNPGRIHFLDSLRGLAALIVVIYHSLLGWRQPGQDGLDFFWFGAGSFLTAGPAAVILFFVLSGIALSQRFLSFPSSQRMDNLHPWEFILARVTRICIPYLCVMLMVAVCRETLPVTTEPDVLPSSKWFGAVASVRGTWEQLIADAPLLFKYPLLVSQGWSLTEELRFSLLMPAILIAGHASSLLLVLFALVSVQTCGLAYHFYFFVAGVLLAKHWPLFETLMARLPRGTPWAFLPLGLACFSISRWFPHHFGPEATEALGRFIRFDYVIGVGSSLLFLAPLGSARLRGFLERRPLLFLGKVSYSLYLVHMIPIIFVGPYVIRALGSLGITDVTTLVAVNTAVMALMSLPLAHICHVSVERPAMRLGRAVSRMKLRAGPPLASLAEA